MPLDSLSEGAGSCIAPVSIREGAGDPSSAHTDSIVTGGIEETSVES